jgi:hypothetical protein
MLSFSNVTSGGFTWDDGYGESGIVQQTYNNSTGNGHLLYRNNALYEIYTDHYIMHTDKSCIFVALSPLDTWVIPHNLHSSTVALAMKEDGTVVFPTKVIETSRDITTLTFSVPIIGRACVRPT